MISCSTVIPGLVLKIKFFFVHKFYFTLIYYKYNASYSERYISRGILLAIFCLVTSNYNSLSFKINSNFRHNHIVIYDFIATWLFSSFFGNYYNFGNQEKEKVSVQLNWKYPKIEGNCTITWILLSPKIGNRWKFEKFFEIQKNKNFGSREGYCDGACKISGS